MQIQRVLDCADDSLENHAVRHVFFRFRLLFCGSVLVAVDQETPHSAHHQGAEDTMRMPVGRGVCRVIDAYRLRGMVVAHYRRAEWSYRRHRRRAE